MVNLDQEPQSLVMNLDLIKEKTEPTFADKSYDIIMLKLVANSVVRNFICEEAKPIHCKSVCVEQGRRAKD